MWLPGSFLWPSEWEALGVGPVLTGGRDFMGNKTGKLLGPARLRESRGCEAEGKRQA